MRVGGGEQKEPLTKEPLTVKLRRISARLTGSYKRMLTLASGQWKTLVLATFFLAIGSILSLVAPQMVRFIIDGAKDKGLSSVDQAASWMLLIFFVQGIAVALRFYLFTIAGQRIVCDLRAQTYRAIIEQEVGFFDRRKTGELINRLASDTQVLQSTVSVNVSMVLRNAAMSVGGIGMLIYTSPKLAGLMLIVVPPVVVASLLASRPLKRYSREVQDALARAGEVAEETISGVRTVRAFGRETRESNRYNDAVTAAFQAMRKRTRFMGIFQGGLSIAGYTSIALVLWYGGRLVVSGAMTVGGLTSFVIYTLLVAISLGSLGSLFTEFVSATGSAERLFEILDRKPLVPLEGGAQLPKLKGEISFDQVNFFYPTRPDIAALKKVSFTIHPGDVVALVGHSGSGKSTVAALLSRFYDPDQGQILLDGVPLNQVDPTWLRKRVGVVSQEPILFSTSIAANIGYGADSFSQQDLERVALMANAMEFIEGFEQGMLTEVGERGVRLSGGQKQRIAIARALLKDPEILVLDEATSALDAESEHLVKQALDRLMRGRTAIVIAHRLSTVKDADKILVLEQGEIVELGTHQELMNRQGVYRKLVERQFMFLPETDKVMKNV